MTNKQRRRSRYAPDNQIDRAAEFALKYGVSLFLGADGSVEIRGKLHVERSIGDESAEEALEAWKRASGYGVARRCLANQRRSDTRRLRLVERAGSQLDRGAGTALDPQAAIEAGDPALTAALELLSDRGVVTDAGGNALLQIDAQGTVSTLAVFPSRLVPGPGGTDVPMQAVPTSIAEGPDGSLYVGELTGFPFPVDGARVYRVPAAGGDPEVIAVGFTNIIDIAIGDDGSAYVLEHDIDGLLQPGTVGRLTKIGPFGSRTELAAGMLDTPGKIAIGPDNAVYVTTHTATAGAGEVVRIAQ